MPKAQEAAAVAVTNFCPAIIASAHFCGAEQKLPNASFLGVNRSTSAHAKRLGRIAPRSYLLALALLIGALYLSLAALPVVAAVLPEDRADILFHNYDGDGSTFNGPSILVRKQYKQSVSAWANYYADYNSAASIDVVTQGSPFEEERIETSAGLDFLVNKTLLSANIKNSSENDYEADNWGVGLSQDFFGDLSTLTLSYSKGDDEVYRNIRNGPSKNNIIGRSLQGTAQHQRFGIGWTQILTKSWILAAKAEASVDEGFLRNAYRQVRFNSASPGEEVVQSREPENYPTTRSSQAFALTSMYYLPWRGALKLEGRVFNDSWEIQASNYEIKYVHPFGEDFVVDFRYRFYDQTQAFFYGEFFNFPEEFDFRASDKELSTFSNTTIGFGVTYALDKAWIGWFDRGTVNLFYDYVNYDYVNFLDKRESDARFFPGDRATPGQESPFTFDAHITRVFLSLWY